MARKTGLGRGLGAIFGTDVVESVEESLHQPEKKEENHVSRETSGRKTVHTVGQTVHKKHENTGNALSTGQTVKTAKTEKKTTPADKKAAEQEESGKEFMMKLSLIEPNEEQPRKDFNEELIGELADSIKKYGVLQPLLVQKKGEHYEIIAGERRWRAAKAAGLKEVPAVLKEYSKQEAMEISLIENVQRADLNPIEEALGYKQLINEFGLTQEEIAIRVAKSRVAITNTMRLLKLDEQIQNMLIQGVISSGHARALLSLEDTMMQLKAAKEILDKKLSVRETEKLVKRMQKEVSGEKKEEKKKDETLALIYQNLEDRMKSVMGTKVSIHNKDKNKGRIEIEYYSEAELERIVEMIESIG